MNDQLQDQQINNLSRPKLQPKSSLLINSSKSTHINIQYIDETHRNQNNPNNAKKQKLSLQAQPLSDQQKQSQINRLRQEYIIEKLNRKKQLMKLKRQQFGSSSSEQDDVGGQQSDSQNQNQNQNERAMSKDKYNSFQVNQHNDDHKIRQNSQYSNKDKQQCHPLIKPQQVYLLKAKQALNQFYLLLKQTSIFLNDRQIQLSKIHKIKSIPQIVSKNLYKLKISYINNEQIMLCASKEILMFKKQKLSLHYLIFGSIIMRKIQMMGLKFYQLQKNVPGVPQAIVKNSFIYGKIFKKSQILGRWQERLIVINQMGIYSYKRFNEAHSMFIARNTVKQIWTRFQIVDQNLLVIKILHSSNTKTQFGIPLTNFMNTNNWLFQFYQLGKNQ